MTTKELRQIAAGAVRAEIRRQGRNPGDVTAQAAWEILDNLNRTEPNLEASRFYRECNYKQQNLFFKEWSN